MAHQKLELPIIGMTCANCAAAVERTLEKKVPGVTGAVVNFGTETATVNFDPAITNPAAMAEAVKKAGYELVLPASTRRVELPVVGMTCANCAATVERTLKKKVKGIHSASVNFGTETATVEFDPAMADLQAMAEAAKKAGYQLLLPADEVDGKDAEQQARERELKKQRRYFVVGLIFTLPLFALSMGRDFFLLGPWSHALWVNWLFLFLAAPVQFYTGWGFYSGGWKSVRAGSANMDVLVALGSSVAFFYSLAVLLFPHFGEHVYFETSALIITLIKLGKLLEAKAKGQASAAIKKLVEHDRGSLPVCSSKGELVGIITERDIVRKCFIRIKDFSEIRIRDVMSQEVAIGTPEDDLDYAISVMKQQRIRHLPIVDKRKVTGMISMRDLLGVQLEESTSRVRLLSDYISGGYV